MSPEISHSSAIWLAITILNNLNLNFSNVYQNGFLQIGIVS